MSSISETATQPRGLSTPLGMLAATVTGALASALVNVVIALLAHAADASQGFQALQPATFIPFTVIGTLAGVVGWTVIRARSSRPAAVLRWVVPIVVLLSLIPDVLVGATSALPGTSWTGVTGLMLMHLSVATAAVVSLRTFLPLKARS